MSDNEKIGVIIFMERASNGVPVSIKNPTCHIGIKRKTTTRRSGVRATLRRRRRKNEAED